MSATEMPPFAPTSRKIDIGQRRVGPIMGRGFLLLWIATVCAVLGSCAPFMANHESEVQLKTVKTPAGPLRLAVMEKGQGRPILLLHGFATSSYTWRAIMPELAKAHRVIALDLRGFGASDKPLDDHYAIEDQAAAVAAFIEQENLRDLTIIGHSFGGGVTLTLALKAGQERPPRVRNIVLVDTIAYRQPIPIFFKLLQVPVVGDAAMTLVPPEVQAGQGLRLAYYDREKISAQDVAEYANTLYSPAAKHALTKTVERMMPDNIDEIASRYKTIKAPTLIVWCEQDKVVPLLLGLRLHEEMRSSEFTLFTHCGHMPQEEKPEDTARAIQAFLGRNGG
jgi:pimeloyl-ACP methyl ester carboxylesterase